MSATNKPTAADGIPELEWYLGKPDLPLPFGCTTEGQRFAADSGYFFLPLFFAWAKSLAATLFSAGVAFLSPSCLAAALAAFLPVATVFLSTRYSIR